MTADQVQTFLPPIVLSIGAILPFLVAAQPFSVRENARILLVCVLTLVIWLGYWGAYAFGDWIFVSQFATASLVISALLLLFFLFFIAQRPPLIERDSNGNEIKDSEGQPKLHLPIDRPAWIWLYLFALLFVAIASALYVGPKDRIILEVEWLAKTETERGELISVESDVGTGEPISLDVVRKTKPGKLMMTKTEFENTKKLLVKVQRRDGEHSEMDNLIALPAAKRELLRPGLGLHYRIRAVPSQ